MLTRTEMADYLKISTRTLKRYMEKGMPYIKMDQKVLFQLDEVITWLKLNTKK